MIYYEVCVSTGMFCLPGWSCPDSLMNRG